MVSIPLPEDELKTSLEEGISLAAVNTSSHCVVSGSHKTIDSFIRKMETNGTECKRLQHLMRFIRK